MGSCVRVGNWSGVSDAPTSTARHARPLARSSARPITGSSLTFYARLQAVGVILGGQHLSSPHLDVVKKNGVASPRYNRHVESRKFGSPAYVVAETVTPPLCCHRL